MATVVSSIRAFYNVILGLVLSLSWVAIVVSPAGMARVTVLGGDLSVSSLNGEWSVFNYGLV